MSLLSRVLDTFSTHSIAAGEAAGLKLITRGTDPNFACGTYERPMQAAISSNLSLGDAFYDVGANVGFFSLIAARKVGPRGRVYAFEPVPGNASAIARGARINDLRNITVFAEAVGAATGRAELLLAHHIGGAVLASAGAPPDMSGRIQVDVVTLDDAIVGRRLRPPSLIKIDVEGAEIDVLRGMAETLRTHRPTIIYEIDDATRDGLNQKARVIGSLLTAAGYSLRPLPSSYPGERWHVEHVLARPGAA
jgi:FkbM family methyltransferase